MEHFLKGPMFQLFPVALVAHQNVRKDKIYL